MLGVVVTLVCIKIYQLVAAEQNQDQEQNLVKIPIHTIEDDVRIIRTIKEIEYWKDFKNGK